MRKIKLITSLFSVTAIGGAIIAGTTSCSNDTVTNTSVKISIKNKKQFVGYDYSKYGKQMNSYDYTTAGAWDGDYPVTDFKDEAMKISVGKQLTAGIIANSIMFCLSEIFSGMTQLDSKFSINFELTINLGFVNEVPFIKASFNGKAACPLFDLKLIFSVKTIDSSPPPIFYCTTEESNSCISFGGDESGPSFFVIDGDLTDLASTKCWEMKIDPFDLNGTKFPPGNWTNNI